MMKYDKRMRGNSTCFGNKINKQEIEIYLFVKIRYNIITSGKKNYMM